MKRDTIKKELERKLREALASLAASKSEQMKIYYDGKVDGLMIALDFLEP